MKIFGKSISFTNKSVPKKWGESYFYPINMSGNTDTLDLTTRNDQLQAFILTPELNAIINLKARQFTSLKFVFLNNQGKEVTGQSIIEVFNNPNFFQAKNEFLYQTKLFREIFGNEYIYKLYPSGFNPDYRNTKKLFTLPPQNMDVKVDDSLPFFQRLERPEIQYNFTINNTVKELSPDEILHINDNNVEFKQDSILDGMSKIESLNHPIKNIIAAYEARGMLLRHRGAIGILSNESKDNVGSIPMEKTEKEELQRAFPDYGVTQGKKPVIITNANLKWSQIVIEVDKLKAFEEIEQDTYKIADAYGVDHNLLASSKNSTFENKKQGEKATYQNTIIPEANEWASAFNRSMGLKDAPFRLSVKFDHLTIFQDDLKERGTALNITVSALSKALTDGAITIDEYKEELNKILGNANS